MPSKRATVEEGSSDDTSDKKQKKTASNKSAAAGPWSVEEELAAYQAIHELALRNLPAIAAAPGLEKRDVSKVNMKVRSMMKKVEKGLGGDGQWIDAFKLGPSKKKE